MYFIGWILNIFQSQVFINNSQNSLAITVKLMCFSIPAE